MNYLESISLTKILPCLAEPGKIIVTGKPSRPLDEVLPYLAILPDVITYNPDAHTLTFRRQPGFLTLYSDRVYITQVLDVEEGLVLLAALVEAINTTWEHRDQLVAVTAARRAPRPLDIWALLPQTNCKQCGEATCMAFACSLLLQNRSLSECLPLQADVAFADRRATLEAMLEQC
jgi:ArsR family metal-binding transcriptional regulator